MRILLLCSAFNGLSQRAWLGLRDAGHDVSVELATSEEAMVSAVSVVRARADHLPVPARAGPGRGVVAVPDDHRAPGSEGRSRAVVVGLGVDDRRSASGA